MREQRGHLSVEELRELNEFTVEDVRNFIDRYGYLNQNGDGDGEEMEFLMVREDGSFLHRTVIDHASKVIKRELGHQQFDFHSLRHPYVKLKTKLFTQANQQFCRQSQFAYPGGQ